MERSGAHINVCEARARQFSVRWRARQVEHIGCRYLHLMDSQSKLCTAAKGCSSSTRMRHVMLKTNPVLLSGRPRDIIGYTRSDRNPADAPEKRGDAMVVAHAAYAVVQSVIQRY